MRAGAAVGGPSQAAAAVPAGGSAGAAMLGTLVAPSPLKLAPPRPEDRVTGPDAPPPPRQRHAPRPGRTALFAKIGLSVVVSVAAFGGRLAVRQFTSDPPETLQRATSASDFSGRCVNLAGGRIETVGCGEPHTGRVRAIVDVSATCPANSIDSIVVRSDPTKRLCIGKG